MLAKLFIKNYALIEEVEIEFQNGLTIITGETGAGKSILLGALKLVLGERADYSIFNEDSQKCIIEATFQLKDNLMDFFQKNDLLFENTSIFRREILPDGKSRSFINDSPVKLQVLQELSHQLIDVHSQFENAELFQEDYQFQFVDNFAGLQENQKKYKALFTKYKELKSKLKQLEADYQNAQQNADYNGFLLEELQSIPLETINQNDLEAELQMLGNIEGLQANLSQIYAVVNNEEVGIDSMLSKLNLLLQKSADMSGGLKNLAERLETLLIDFKDINKEIEDFYDDLEFNPEKYQSLNTQNNTLQNLFKKHNTQSIEELIKIKESLALAQNDFHNFNVLISETKEEIKTTEEQLHKEAENIRQIRLEKKPVLEKEILSLFTQLGLEKAQFEIQYIPEEVLNEYGKDQVQILFSANTGIPAQPIAKAISGGERSRVMLALKKVAAENESLETLILDEIDTGVSGRIADAIGNMMEDMARYRQIIVITHLPQIASKGNSHIKVFKTEENGKTITSLKPLSETARVEEVAQLLSGETLTDASIKQAKELLQK